MDFAYDQANTPLKNEPFTVRPRVHGGVAPTLSALSNAGNCSRKSVEINLRLLKVMNDEFKREKPPCRLVKCIYRCLPNIKKYSNAEFNRILRADNYS